jgi:hypothetical protein
MAREHDWKYGGGVPEETAYRFCGSCRMRQWAIDPADWDSAEFTLWRMDDDGKWGEMPAPECPDAASPESEWSRVEDGHPRWEIRNPNGDGKNYLCADEAIRTFGRRHMEKILAGLPPLPGKAWEVTGG